MPARPSLPSIRAKIAMLVLACALPTAIGFTGLVHHFYQREREHLSTDVRQSARAAALAVDRELDVGVIALRALAGSPTLQNGNMTAFHDEASALLRQGFPGDAFILTDAGGQQLLNTRLPYGQPLPMRGNAAQVRRVFGEGKLIVSSLYTGLVSRQTQMAIDLPVWRDGKIVYALGFSFSAERMGKLLREQHLPPSTVMSVVDDRGIVVARTLAPEKYVGQPIRPATWQLLRQAGEGMIHVPSLEGVPMYVGFSRAPRSGWSVTVGVPEETVLSELLDSVSRLTAAVAALMLAGFALAWHVGGGIRRSVKALTLPADALAADRTQDADLLEARLLALPALDFREAEEVATDLRHLAVDAQRYRLQLEALVARRTEQLNESNVLLQSVYATAPVGLCQVDSELRFVAINEYLAAIDGKSVQEHIGQRLSALIGDVGLAVEALYRRVLDSGEALVGLELSGSVPPAPQEIRYWTVSYYPVRGADGLVVGVTGVVLDISERKRMETRLRDSEEYFRVLYESARDAHLLVTPQGGFVGANEAAVTLFGCRGLDELLGLSPAATSPEFQPDGRRSAIKAQEMMEQAFEHGWHSFEWVHRRRDGADFHADILLAALDIGGEHILQATVRDIDERKRTEMALRQSRLLLKSILENMPAMIFAKTAAGLRYEIFNRSAEQFLGHARAAVLGKSDRDLFPPAQAEQMMLTDYRVLAAPSFVETELQPMTNASGETRFFTMRQVALRNDNGSATHILGVAIDVTERKQALERLSATSSQLERNERFIRTITDSLPGMVGYWDAGLRCRFANKRYLEWYGRTQEEIGHITLEELLGEGYVVSRPHLDGVMAGRPQTFERAMRRPDGTPLHSWVSYLPDLDNDGAVRGFFVLISDITVLKQTELRLQDLNEELVQARDRAEAASSAKSEFLANMSHEIRTPMNAIIGLARLLEEAPLERRERSYVAKIKLATQSLLGVLNDVLDFSKIEAGRLALEHAPFTLDHVLADTAVLVTANAWAKGVEPVFSVAPDVPLVLTGDAMRLQQVLLNLIGNAVKFTERGEVVLSVARVQQDGAHVTLGFSVRDTGIGIAPAQQESMFDAFSQGDTSTSRKYGGAGLGLAICRRLVGLMGGAIDVRSAPGAGSTFRFSAVFELAAGNAGAADANLLQAPLDADLRGLAVLVVDDNASARAVIAEACAALGWSCDSAAGGAEALALLQHRARRWPAPPDPAERYDLMLLDSAMPGLDGISMLMQARADQRLEVPPVVMMVADNASENLQRIADGLQIGAILTKPTTPSRVLAAVRALRQGAPLGAAAPVPLPTPLSGRLAGLRILLAEDNEINQEVAQYILLHAGARVDIAGHGALALELLAAATEPYDAVLMDLQMPVMNGYEATRAIRALGLRLPVIAMTANAMPEDRQRAIECGMDAHIAKPIEVDDLIATLTRLAPPNNAAASGASVPDGLPAQLPGIDLKAALQRFGGNYAAFAGLLRRFENSQGDAVAEARRLIDAGERQAAMQMLHRLRGVAANLGANDVATYASTAETALRGGQQVELSALLDALDGAMTLVFTSARALPMAAGAGMAMAADPAQRGAASNDLPLALAHLRALLQNSNMKALTAFHALQPRLELVEREAALALADAVETLSFAAAERLVQQLLQRMEGDDERKDSA